MTKRLAMGMLCGAVLLTGAACGDDTADDEGAGASNAGRPCVPVGSELERSATETIAVELRDFEFVLARNEISAGVVTFEVENAGSEDHELAFIPGGGDVPMTPEGTPDEDALEAAGAFELEAFGPGTTCAATYQLDPGTYTLFCIVESPDGMTHHRKGMVATLTVV